MYFKMIGSWLINSRVGQALILATAIMLSAFLAYKWAYNHGRDDCRAEIVVQQANANINTHNEGVARDAKSSEIATTTTTKAAEDIKKIDTTTNTSKEVIRYVYRNPPKGKAATPGSCVRPVDKRVQDIFDKGIDQANGS